MSQSLVPAQYFAIVDEGFTREAPCGLVRRRTEEGRTRKRDEGFTQTLQWERTFFFMDRDNGRGDDVSIVEVSLEEAQRIVTLLADRRSAKRALE